MAHTVLFRFVLNDVPNSCNEQPTHVPCLYAELLQAHVLHVLSAGAQSAQPPVNSLQRAAGHKRGRHQRALTLLDNTEGHASGCDSEGPATAAYSQALVTLPADSRGAQTDSRATRTVPGAARVHLLATVFLKQVTQDNKHDVSVNYCPDIGIDELVVCMTGSVCFAITRSHSNCSTQARMSSLTDRISAP